jgi:hypothetical protein
MTTARIIMGHGEEKTQPFEARKSMPPGYTLITLAECGMSTIVDQVAKIIEAFSLPENKLIFEDPTRHRKDLKMILQGLDTHIYTEGMLYPEMKIHLFTYWEKAEEVETTDTQLAITKSGIYEFPLDREAWRLQNANTINKSMIGTVELASSIKTTYTSALKFRNSNELAEKSYSGSIFPTPSKVTKILKANDNNIFKFAEHMIFPLETIFEKCGPGIYYHFICRGSVNTGIHNYLNSFSENYEIPPLPKEYETNSLMAVPYLLPYMEAAKIKREKKYNKAIEAMMTNTKKSRNQLSKNNLNSVKYWNYTNLIEAPTKFKKAHNIIKNTRRKSISQQKNKGGRRTRHKK